MALQPNIILSGAQPDILGAMSRGNELAAQTNTLRDQNALRQVYQTQGAGILSGDQNSLNALAMIDPITAINAQGGVLSNRTEQRKFEIMNAQEKRAIAEAAAQMDERQAAEALKKTQQEVLRFVMAPDAATFDQMVTQAGRPEFAGMFDQRERLGALFMENFTDAFKTALGTKPDPSALTDGAPAGKMWIDPNNRALGVRDLPGAETRQAPYTTLGKLKRDLESGEITQAEYELELARLAPKGTELIIDPATNQVTFRQGVGVGGNGEATIGDAYNPSEVAMVMDDIDAIKNADPKLLARITGPLAGGGGNNVDDLTAAQRVYLGADGLALVERIGQLQSKTWLSARQMLKGGGAITDYESRKAEAAVARLSRTKDPAALLEALQELQDAIRDGEAKLRAAGRLGAQPSAPAANPADMSDEDLLKMYGG